MYKSLLLAIILGLFNSSILRAQLGGMNDDSSKLTIPLLGWEQDLGSPNFNEEGRAIIATADGGAALVGYAQHGENRNVDLWLLKLDADGKKQWEKYLGSPNNLEMGMDIIQLANGDYMVVGTKYNINFPDIWLLRLNAVGEVLWEKSYGSTNHEEGNSIIETPDGGFAIAGGKAITSPREMIVAYLLKTDALGNKQWDKEFGAEDIDAPNPRHLKMGITTPNNKIANDLTMTIQGGYALTGYTNSNTTGQLSTDFWTILTDNKGNLIRSAKAGPIGGDEAFEVLQHPDGNLWVAGLIFGINEICYSVGLFCMSDPTRPNRDTLLLYNNKDNKYENARAAALYQKEYMLLAGETDINRDAYTFEAYDKHDIRKVDPWLICIDKTGKMLWDKVWHHQKPTKALSVATGKRGDIWLTGFSENADNRKDLWVAKIW